MSGVVVVDARHATGNAGRVLRAYQRAHGVFDEHEMRARLASKIPIEALRDADQAFVRVSDREWVTVKDRYGKVPARIGPEEMSEILARQRKVELGILDEDPWREIGISQTVLSGEGTARVDENAPGRQWITKMLSGEATWDEIKWPYGADVLRHMIDTGQLTPDGSDITLHFGDVGEGLTFPRVRDRADAVPLAHHVHVAKARSGTKPDEMFFDPVRMQIKDAVEDEPEPGGDA